MVDGRCGGGPGNRVRGTRLAEEDWQHSRVKRARQRHPDPRCHERLRRPATRTRTRQDMAQRDLRRQRASAAGLRDERQRLTLPQHLRRGRGGREQRLRGRGPGQRRLRPALLVWGRADREVQDRRHRVALIQRRRQQQQRRGVRSVVDFLLRDLGRGRPQAPSAPPDRGQRHAPPQWGRQGLLLLRPR